MKVRPPKNVRQGRVGRNSKHRADQPKTRKELRKEKRQQKKLNRFNYHNRSRKDRLAEYGEDPFGSKKKGKQGKFGSKNRPEENSEDDFEDEEIESDFSDEVEPVPKNSKNVATAAKMDVERQKEMKELKQYEESLKEKRIEQLQAANEEDDRVIQKYEKLLKINRRKNSQGVAKSFNDGLDYALELCTDENIKKMYEAAKEAAELEEEAADEFIEDLQQVVGGVRAGGEEEGSESSEKPREMSEQEKRRVEKLKKIEEKYLGLDELDDLGAYDSEMEMDEEDENVAESDYSENDELYDSDDDFDDDDDDNDGLEESEEEESNDTKKKRKVKFAEDLPSSKKRMKQTQPESEPNEDEVRQSKNELKPREKKQENGKATESNEEKNCTAGRFVLLKPKQNKQAKKNDKNGKKQTNGKKSQQAVESDDEEEFDENNDFADFSDEDEENDGLDDLLNEDESDEDQQSGEENETSKEPAKSDGTWEDIYGRKRDKAGNVIKEETAVGGGKYIPPHLRARMEAEAAAKASPVDPMQQEKLNRLKRHLKGQINRLAESNVHRISIEMDNMYMQHARYDMTSTLTTLILEAIVAPTLTPERMVLEHMLLVAILHANVGNEVGSHFLEAVVERFLALAKDIERVANEAKQLDNCIQILCHLYTFDIVKGKLMHEVIQRLVDCFNEKSVECILLVLRAVGFILRKDDPLALKELVVTIQKKAANAPDELKNDPRVKFMLESLLAVKNNNMHKIPQYDPTLVEHFRKLLKGMITNGKYISTLNIGLQDIIDIPVRGKWWLVGSAWQGNRDSSTGTTAGRGGTADQADGGQFSQQLLELARRQRMNTDDRRNVFCIVMSAEDYLDAFEKLLRLAIKDQRVVVSVIIHCSLAEKEYNPYYSVLSQKFCDYDRRYQLAIQFALWDRLKEIHSLKQPQVRNLARFITHLIAEGGLAISCLKVIDFADIDKVNLRLMRQIMLGLLLLDDENKCLQVFSRISASFKLKSFKDSLRLFMHHFLARSTKESKQLPEEPTQLLQSRIKQADQLLGTDDTRFVYKDDDDDDDDD